MDSSSRERRIESQRSKLQNLLDDSCVYISQIHRSVKRFQNLNSLIYMKRDVAKDHIQKATNTLIQRVLALQDVFEKDLAEATKQKESKVKERSDALLATIRKISTECNNAEDLLSIGEENSLLSKGNKVANCLTELMKESDLDKMDGMGLLDFVPKYEKSLFQKPEDLGYIKVCELDPVLASIDSKDGGFVGIEENVILFAAESHVANGLDYLSVEVYDSKKKLIPVQITDLKDGSYNCSFTPTVVGTHSMHVKIYQIHISESPFEFDVVELNSDGDTASSDKESLGKRVVTRVLNEDIGVEKRNKCFASPILRAIADHLQESSNKVNLQTASPRKGEKETAVPCHSTNDNLLQERDRNERRRNAIRKMRHKAAWHHDRFESEEGDKYYEEVQTSSGSPCGGSNDLLEMEAASSQKILRKEQTLYMDSEHTQSAKSRLDQMQKEPVIQVKEEPVTPPLPRPLLKQNSLDRDSNINIKKELVSPSARSQISRPSSLNSVHSNGASATLCDNVLVASKVDKGAVEDEIDGGGDRRTPHKMSQIKKENESTPRRGRGRGQLKYVKEEPLVGKSKQGESSKPDSPASDTGSVGRGAYGKIRMAEEKENEVPKNKDKSNVSSSKDRNQKNKDEASGTTKDPSLLYSWNGKGAKNRATLPPTESTLKEVNKNASVENNDRELDIYVEYVGQLGKGKGEQGLKFPLGVTINVMTQDIFVCDGGNDCVKIFDGRTFDLVGTMYGTPGFKKPSAIVITERNIYVKDDHHIQVYSNTEYLEFQYNIGRGILKRPYGLALTENDELVTFDQGKKCIFYFSSSGTVEQTYVESIDREFGTRIRFLDVWKDRVILSNLGSHAVHIIDQNGTVLQNFGSVGHGPGQFNEPSGCSVDRYGNIFVADSRNNRIQYFSESGKFKCNVALDSPIHRPSDILLTDQYLLVSSLLGHNVKIFKMYDGSC